MSKEKMVKRTMNLLISFWRGVISCNSLALAAKLAICPMNVRSPVPKTTPIPVPSLAKVEKKAMFFVSKGSSSVHLEDLD